MAQKTKNEEKFYTAEEVAIAVLKKTEELIRASSLAKANTSHEIEEGEEPNNDDAEAPEYLANADIEDSGAHGEKKGKKKGAPGMEAADQDGDGDVDGADAMEMADKDGDGDVDGEDAMEEAEEASGEDLDGDDEAGEAPEHKEKIEAAAKAKPKADEDKDKDETIDGVVGKEKKKPAFMKSEVDKCGDMSEGKKPSLKKFMLQRKMKKSGGPTADARAAEKLSGAPMAPAAPEKIKEQPSPAQKVKAQPKMQMEKNKNAPTEQLLGIKPKAGK